MPAVVGFIVEYLLDYLLEDGCSLHETFTLLGAGAVGLKMRSTRSLEVTDIGLRETPVIDPPSVCLQAQAQAHYVGDRKRGPLCRPICRPPHRHAVSISLRANHDSPFESLEGKNKQGLEELAKEDPIGKQINREDVNWWSGTANSVDLSTSLREDSVCYRPGHSWALRLSWPCPWPMAGHYVARTSYALVLLWTRYRGLPLILAAFLSFCNFVYLFTTFTIFEIRGRR